MLLDGVDNRLAQLVLPGNLDAVLDMGDEDQTGHGGRQLVVLVFAGGLVFDEIQRLFHFADVVVISAHFGQQRIGADFGGGGLHQRADDHRVVVGARGFQHQAPQDGTVQVG